MNFCDIWHIPHEIIGHSVMGQSIYAFFVGRATAGKRVLITGGMHAREWITALVVCELTKKYFALCPPDTQFIFVPLCNPDGVRLAMDNPEFALWKANANMVDLNVNFDAGWGTGAQNVFAPAPENYVGEKPESEPETRALVDLVRRVRPTASIAFHSKGEVVYYGFDALSPDVLGKTKTLADNIAQITGYTAVRSHNSTGGLTDWVAFATGAPSVTIEVGNDDLPHPITEMYLPQIMGRVNNVLDIFL